MKIPAITIANVNKTFTDPPGEHLLALKDINVDIKMGEFFVIVGPSGCGKSTLLRIMSGLETVHQGTSTLGPGLTKQDMSFVFQQFALLPWLTVSENIELGLIAHGVPAHDRAHILARELTQFGLEKFGHSHIGELSGGMRQRVGMARALATDPKIIFMDEPFSELDSFTAEELRQELLAIWEERKITIVMVTHIVQEAIELADRIAVMTARPGKIERIVTNTLARPRAKRSADFYKLEDEITGLIKP
jgi:NitT/TauT family transport system ATP-binding protein